MASRSTQTHAPELYGRGGWINTNGRNLNLGDLRGRVVLLDFWTSSCINCIHVLEELRELEHIYSPTQVTALGIHSPKFEHEGTHEAVVAAVERNGIKHPVLDDPDLTTWSAYGVGAWPTLVLIDQEGYIVYVAAGEKQLPALKRVIDDLLKSDRHDEHPADATESTTVNDPAAIKYPSKILGLPDRSFLLLNTGNHNLLHLDSDATTVKRVIGSGVRGSKDGALETAEFSEPTAAIYLEQNTSAKLPYDVLIADRANHALRTLRLDDGYVSTLAKDLISPWDLAYWPAVQKIVIAMAGRHFLATIDFDSRELSVLAGNGREGIRDGRADRAEFAQTTGLAAELGPDGSLWLVDSETSALRRLRVSGSEIVVETLVGKGLFDFGYRDGPAEQALLQHPEDVCVTSDGEVLVADTYNGAVRKYDPSTKSVSTVESGLNEPTGVLVSGPDLYVVESAAGRLSKIPLQAENTVADGASLRSRTTVVEVAPEMAIEIGLELPEPMTVDPETEDPIRVSISSTPSDLITNGAGPGHELRRSLTLSPSVKTGTIHISAKVAYCDPVQGLCTLMTKDWNIHVNVGSDGTKKIALILSGPPSS